jgi:hypothetical protein
MKLLFLAAGVALAALPANAQIIVGCGPPAIANADLGNAANLGAQADCWHKATATTSAAEQTRRDRIKAIAKVVPPPVPAPVPVVPPVVPPGVGGSGTPITAPPPLPRPTPIPTPLPPVLPPPSAPPVQASAVQIGISAVPQVYYGTERIWANLAYRSSEWQGIVGGTNDQGNPNTEGRVYLTAPNAVYTGQPTKITCTWQGNGKAYLAASDWAVTDHAVTGTWAPAGPPGKHGGMWFSLSESDGTFRNLDCREAGVVSNGRLDQRYVDDMKTYSVIRFLDWVNANNNLPVTWATRALPGTAYVNGDQPLEDMIEIANAAGADAWFNIPWNTDDDYVRRMAMLIRDTLKGKAYFETGNEVWNWVFGVTTQALNEGMAENLSPDNKWYGVMFRYAEKSTQNAKILTDVFKDQPGRLVRVASFQSGNTFGLDQYMTFRDSAQWIDAIADAPYFGTDVLNTATATTLTLDQVIALAEAGRVQYLKNTDNLAVAAKKYGKRSMIYEGGNGTISSDINADANVLLQHSPAMGALYDRYLAGLKATHDGPLMLYNSTGVTSKYGAWGQHDFTGAPSVKLDAIIRAQGKR